MNKVILKSDKYRTENIDFRLLGLIIYNAPIPFIELKIKLSPYHYTKLQVLQHVSILSRKGLAKFNRRTGYIVLKHRYTKCHGEVARTAEYWELKKSLGVRK